MPDQIRQKETTVRNEAFGLSEKIREQGIEKSSKMLSAVRVEINKLQSNARIDADNKLARARKKLNAESEVLAVGIMEKVLERRLLL
jgi:F-type H+-transporting ATPase subunit b